MKRHQRDDRKSALCTSREIFFTEIRRQMREILFKMFMSLAHYPLGLYFYSAALPCALQKSLIAFGKLSLHLIISIFSLPRLKTSPPSRSLTIFLFLRLPSGSILFYNPDKRCKMERQTAISVSL